MIWLLTAAPSSSFPRLPTVFPFQHWQKYQTASSKSQQVVMLFLPFSLPHLLYFFLPPLSHVKLVTQPQENTTTPTIWSLNSQSAQFSFCVLLSCWICLRLIWRTRDVLRVVEYGGKTSSKATSLTSKIIWCSVGGTGELMSAQAYTRVEICLRYCFNLCDCAMSHYESPTVLFLHPRTLRFISPLLQ